MTPRQKLQVRHWINGKDPRQYGFDFGLWTRQVVAALIAQQFGVRVGVTAAGRLLAELDITPQKLLRRAYERDPAAIAHWQTTVFPRLRARAQRVGATIFFLDEAGVRSDQVLGRTWGLRGQTPEVPTSGRRQSVNAVSAVNAQGAFWYEIYTERLNVLRRPFVEGRNEHATEVDRPDAIVNLVETEVVLLESVGDEAQPPRPADASSVRPSALLNCPDLDRKRSQRGIAD